MGAGGLGILACAAMAAAQCPMPAPLAGSLAAALMERCHPGDAERERSPDHPGGCHAALGCAAHRKLKGTAT